MLKWSPAAQPEFHHSLDGYRAPSPAERFREEMKRASRDTTG
jgi:hypothetical protein